MGYHWHLPFAPGPSVEAVANGYRPRMAGLLIRYYFGSEGSRGERQQLGAERHREEVLRGAAYYRGRYEMSSVTVKIPTPLRPITAGQSEVKLEGATVGEILRKMDTQFKGFGERVLDDGKNVKRFINVFVNEDNIRDRKELETELKNGDTISILPSIAGGNSQF